MAKIKTKVRVTRVENLEPQWGDLPNGLSFVQIDYPGKLDCVVSRYDESFTLQAIEGDDTWVDRRSGGLPRLLKVYSEANITLK